MNRNLARALAIVVIYAVSAGVSYFAFSEFLPKGDTKSYAPKSTSTKLVDGRTTFDSGAPKTEECPTNGAKYPKEQRKWWEGHRPLGVMIENHEESRPQSGLSYADVIYEAVAEGGITRFLAVFYCQDAGQIGPVRSARTYFLDFISEYGDYPLYAHVGGANTPGPANAISQISDYDWTGYNDLNQFSIGFPTFWRDYNRLGHAVATEHTMYSTTEKLWKFAADSRDINLKDKEGNNWQDSFLAYKFKEDPTTKPLTPQTISLEFWEGKSDYAATWKYDSAANQYLRVSGDKPYTDKNNSKQLSAKNIVVLFMTERRANDGYEGNVHLLYGTKGTGKAVVFMDGKRTNGTWEKDSRTSRTIVRVAGEEVKFNRGAIWFEILPTNGVAEVK